MEIIEVTRYKFEGVEYPSLAKVKTEIENQLGAIIDKMDVNLTPKQRLNILAAMTKDKKQIVKLLTVEFNNASNDLQGDYKNILDL